MPEECPIADHEIVDPPPPTVVTGGGTIVYPVGQGYVGNPFASGAVVFVRVNGDAKFDALTSTTYLQPGSFTFKAEQPSTIFLNPAGTRSFSLPQGGTVVEGGISTTYSPGSTVTISSRAEVTLANAATVIVTGGIAITVTLPVTQFRVIGLVEMIVPASARMTVFSGTGLVSSAGVPIGDWFLFSPSANAAPTIISRQLVGVTLSQYFTTDLSVILSDFKAWGRTRMLPTVTTADIDNGAFLFAHYQPSGEDVGPDDFVLDDMPDFPGVTTLEGSAEIDSGGMSLPDLVEALDSNEEDMADFTLIEARTLVGSEEEAPADVTLIQHVLQATYVEDFDDFLLLSYGEDQIDTETISLTGFGLEGPELQDYSDLGVAGFSLVGSILDEAEYSREEPEIFDSGVGVDSSGFTLSGDVADFLDEADIDYAAVDFLSPTLQGAEVQAAADIIPFPHELQASGVEDFLDFQLPTHVLQDSYTPEPADLILVNNVVTDAEVNPSAGGFTLTAANSGSPETEDVIDLTGFTTLFYRVATDAAVDGIFILKDRGPVFLSEHEPPDFEEAAELLDYEVVAGNARFQLVNF